MPENQGQGKAMTSSDASRIQSSQARGGGDMSSDGFAARAQSAGARNDNAQTGNQGGGNASNTASGQGKK
ncbi:hypothetical protein GGR55DRAFT_629398 [Xylaria sp. FL0064]|nr:hypothetical protein GGR55DRAFT_629398 [Xylaria sp. FL0064]